MTTAAEAPQISEDEYRKFRDYFYRTTGMYFEDSKRYFVDKRLLERIEKTGSDCFRDYFAMLRFQNTSDELQQLVNLMTVNETYFFREEYQFQALVASMLDEIVARPRKPGPVRIWSIPCSTGEEPYSIAIYLLEKWPRIHEVDVEILASDIDTNVLDTARAGIYEKRSLQHMPEAYRQKYFTSLPMGRYQLSESIRSAVEFSKVNLSSRSQTMRFRDIDLIFCRNLLIYFDDLSRKSAAETLFETLRPGGFVCLGHSESMSRISSLFKIRKLKDAIVYQKE
jgi:chemotaxis protein methyltransferase CheR